MCPFLCTFLRPNFDAEEYFLECKHKTYTFLLCSGSLIWYWAYTKTSYDKIRHLQPRYMPETLNTTNEYGKFNRHSGSTKRWTASKAFYSIHNNTNLPWQKNALNVFHVARLTHKENVNTCFLCNVFAQIQCNCWNWSKMFANIFWKVLFVFKLRIPHCRNPR